MRTRQLGDGGPELSTVGFGAWAIGGRWRFGWGDVDDDESIAAIRRAVELGVNWVDTAAVYGLGHSEDVVRRALEPFAVGEEVLVFTKCGRRWEGRPDGVIENDLRPASIREECEASLRRLGVERIDLYQAHWPDWSTGTPIEESWATMAALVDEGKVRWIGACNFDVDLLDRCEEVRHVNSVQPPLSLLVRGTLDTVVPWAAAHGAGVLCYSPLGSGLLTGAFDRVRLATLAEDDWRREAAAFREPQVSRTLALVERLRVLAESRSTTVAALAVGWVLAQPGVTGAIVGARTAGHVDGWSSAAGLELDEDELAAIGAAIDETGAGTDEPPAPPPHIPAAAYSARAGSVRRDASVRRPE
jgi:aryl-alcohol dehydrogenase-like predicted oxidoreductase